MNTLSFVPVDTVFEAQFDLAQDWVAHVLNVLPKGVGGVGMNEQGVRNFYPAVQVPHLEVFLLNSCLEAMKEFMFFDGVGVQQKKALLSYHFQYKTKISGQRHSVKDMLDQVLMTNGKTLSENRQEFIDTRLHMIVKSREHLQENQKLLEDLRRGQEGISQKIGKLIVEEHDHMSNKKKEIERLNKLSREAEEQIVKMTSHVEAYQKNKNMVDQTHLMPFLNLSYEKESLEQHIVLFWKEIVEQARLSELKALPEVLLTNTSPLNTKKPSL